MYFLIEDLLEKYNTLSCKISADIKKEFGSEPGYNKEFWITKIKSRGDEIINFSHERIPKVDSNHNCLAVINNLGFCS